MMAAWGYDFSPSHWPLTVTVCTGERQNDGCMGQWGWHTQREKLTLSFPKSLCCWCSSFRRQACRHSIKPETLTFLQLCFLQNMLVKDIKGAGSRLKILIWLFTDHTWLTRLAVHTSAWPPNQPLSSVAKHLGKAVASSCAGRTRLVV